MGWCQVPELIELCNLRRFHMAPTVWILSGLIYRRPATSRRDVCPQRYLASVRLSVRDAPGAAAASDRCAAGLDGRAFAIDVRRDSSRSIVRSTVPRVWPRPSSANPGICSHIGAPVPIPMRHLESQGSIEGYRGFVILEDLEEHSLRAFP